MGKKYDESSKIERMGIALCASLVSEMGHIWREKNVDYGIDGEIELVNDGVALNRVLWVQSKARGAAHRFDRENDRAFAFRCRQVDIEYWLSGTAPVLLVCSHPESREAWFKNLRTWFADPERRRDRVVTFDKSNDRFDASAVRDLLDIGVPVESGIYLRPPPRPETLTSNLLQVQHLAETVHWAPTKVRGWTDSNARLIKAGHRPVSDVVFREGKVYSLRRLDEQPLDVLTDGTPERMAVDELADSKSEDDQRLLVWLLNGTLKDLTHRDLRFHRDGPYLYFKGTPDLRPRKVKAGPRSKGRTIFQCYSPKEGASWTSYYRHHALDQKFLYADGHWFLALNPTYHFTSDGRNESSFAALLTKGIKQREGHEAVRGLVGFWAHYLTESPNLFSGPPDQRLRFGQLVTVDVPQGIDDAYWKPHTPSADSIRDESVPSRHEMFPEDP